MGNILTKDQPKLLLFFAIVCLIINVLALICVLHMPFWFFLAKIAGEYEMVIFPFVVFSWVISLVGLILSLLEKNKSKETKKAIAIFAIGLMIGLVVFKIFKEGFLFS